jgi:hypothetical protein
VKTLTALFILASCLVSGAPAADPAATAATPVSDGQRIDLLIRQNQSLLEENQRLKGECARPKTKDEAFAACMQAAKGQTSPMAAESIGGHCDQLLRK